MDKKSLTKIIEQAGGSSAVGRALGISPQAVSQWRKCPAERARGLAALAGVHPHEIRPDLYEPPEEPTA